MGFIKDMLIVCGIIKESKNINETQTDNIILCDLRLSGDTPTNTSIAVEKTTPSAQFDKFDTLETLNPIEQSKNIDAVAELSKILQEEINKANTPIDAESIQKLIEEDSKNTNEIPTSDLILDYSEKEFALYSPEHAAKEKMTISPSHSRSLSNYKPKPQYEYNKPLVIKVTNLKDSRDIQIYISPKQFCEHFGVKPKQLYTCLNSKDKIINSNYKLEIIQFMESHPIYSVNLSEVHSVDVTNSINEENNTNTTVVNVKVFPKKGVEFINLTDMVITPTGVKFTEEKRKFVSIAEKTPALVAEWDEIRNGVPASKVPHSIKKDAYWICQTCGTSYKRRVDNRTRRPEVGCTKCFNKVLA